MKFLRLLIPLLLFLPAGCAWLKGGVSNLAPPAPLVAFRPTIKIHKLWSASTGAGAGEQYLTLRPVLAEGRLLVADHSGRVSAYQPQNGKRLWQVNLKTALTAIGSAPGLVLLGSRTGEVVALNATNGTKIWSAEVSSEVLAPPVGTSGTVVVQTIDGKLAALGVTDGSILWSEDHTLPSLMLYTSSTPVVTGGMAISGFADGRVYATNLLSGTTVWAATLGEPRGSDEIERLVDADSTPLVSGGVVYAASYQGNAVALSARSGRVLWSTPVSTYRDIALGESHVYVANAQDAVMALDRNTGANVWTQSALSGRRISGPALIGGEVVVGDHEGYLHWMSRSQGAFVGRVRLGESAIRAQPVVGTVAGRSVLFVLSQDGQLAAFAPSS